MRIPAKLILAASLSMASLPALSDHVPVPSGERFGISFINGGIGEHQKAAVEAAAAAGDYNLSITLATEGTHAYRAQVPLAIMDSDGKHVFHLHEAGPLVHVKLPAGRYTVNIDDANTGARKTVNVRDGKRRSLVFYSVAESNNAQPKPSKLDLNRQGNITWISGGADAASRDAFEARAEADDFNVKLVFATPQDSAFLTRVPLRLYNSDDIKVLDIVANGPLFYANVPPGNYTVAMRRRTNVNDPDPHTHRHAIKIRPNQLNETVFYTRLVPE